MATEDNKKVIAPVGAWSDEKLDLLRCYLGTLHGKGGFLPTTKTAQQRYYIDLFAGPGQNQVRGTNKIVDGSPLIALKAGPPQFTRLFWVEANAKNAASLNAHRDEHLDRQIEIFQGDANVQIDNVLRVLPKVFPVFAFLDPRVAELSWKTVEKLARHKQGRKIELFILFAYNQGLVRLMPHDPDKMVYGDILDRVMPDPNRWRDVYANRVQKKGSRSDFRSAMLDEYVFGLKSLGYEFVPKPRLIFTPEGRPLYFMIFASDHDAGDTIMTWCLQNVQQKRRQGSLFPYDQQY